MASLVELEHPRPIVRLVSGCLGEFADRAKAAFPWARGALVVNVESVEMQL